MIIDTLFEKLWNENNDTWLKFDTTLILLHFFKSEIAPILDSNIYFF